jgi:hypothetical protein
MASVAARVSPTRDVHGCKDGGSRGLSPLADEAVVLGRMSNEPRSSQI